MPSFIGRIKSGFENVKYTKTGSTVDYAEPVDTSSPIFIRDLTSGTGVNQANYFFKREYSIASGGNVVIDLNGSANKNRIGPLSVGEWNVPAMVDQALATHSCTDTDPPTVPTLCAATAQ